MKLRKREQIDLLEKQMSNYFIAVEKTNQSGVSQVVVELIEALNDKSFEVEVKAANNRKIQAQVSDEKGNLGEEICVLSHDAFVQSNISEIYQNIISEKLQELKPLAQELVKLGSENNNHEERLEMMTHKLENA